MAPSEHPFFNSLPEAEKVIISKTAQEVAQRLGNWAPRYPIIRAKRIPPVAVLVAGVLPLMPIEQVLLVGKLILMVFALDDIADERLYSLEAFRQRSQVWEEIVRSGQMPPGAEEQDDLSGIFLELRQEYSQYLLFNEFNDLWVSRLRSLCETVAREYEYGLAFSEKAERGLPDLEEYLQVGLHSVGAPFWGTAILILLSEPSTLQQIETINQAILDMGASMRLYNDLRSYEKELQESTINAITILQSKLRHENPDLEEKQVIDQAREAVRSLAAGYADKSLQQVKLIHTETGQFEETIIRTIAFHAYFYGSDQHKKDYHNLSSSESFSMIG